MEIVIDLDRKRMQAMGANDVVTLKDLLADDLVYTHASATSLGEARDLGPGSAVLLEDTRGRGHVSTVTSAVPFDAIIIRLE